ncbi:MAG: energy transducer TonB [Thiotrichales bacterium]|nr:energy transducer TonB [Thiotrichales bacterium]
MSTETIDSLGDSASVQTVLRFLISLVLAIAITFFLLWAMQALVATGDRSIADDRDRLALDFVRIERSETLERKKHKPDKPPLPDKPPPQPPQPKLDDINPHVEKISVSVAPVGIEVKLSSSGFSLGLSEGEFLPLAKVSPVYPQRALRRGIEGFCTVQYTVTSTGATSNVAVLEDQCTSKVFHQTSIAAAKRFKYRPRVRDGNAVDVPGVRNKFTYQLEK